MQYPIGAGGFEGRGLMLRVGFLGGVRLFIDGARVKPANDVYILQNNLGGIVLIRLKRRLPDPVPLVQVGVILIDVATPLAWYEYLLTAVPLLLALAGMFLSGLARIAPGF